MRRPPLAALCALMTAVLLGGCGAAERDSADAGGKEEAGSARPLGKDIDPCTLLTAQEVTAAMSQPAAESIGNDGVSAKVCIWDATSGERSVFIHLPNANVMSWTDKKTHSGYGWGVGEWDALASEKAKRRVTGVADAAWYGVEGHAGTLYVRKGSFGFIVGMEYRNGAAVPPEDDVLVVLRPLADAIATRS